MSRGRISTWTTRRTCRWWRAKNLRKPARKPKRRNGNTTTTKSRMNPKKYVQHVAITLFSLWNRDYERNANCRILLNQEVSSLLHVWNQTFIKTLNFTFIIFIYIIIYRNQRRRRAWKRRKQEIPPARGRRSKMRSKKFGNGIIGISLSNSQTITWLFLTNPTFFWDLT